MVRYMVDSQGRGRPIDQEKQEEQKTRLLDAARDLLVEKSYRSVTIRELGEKAGVNSAMIRYYFSNKEGLFIALLDRMSEQHFSRMQEFNQSSNPLKAIIQGMLQMLAENSGFARMIHDEVMVTDSPFRDAFIERFPKKMANFLPRLVQQSCQIDDPKRAKYLAFNLITLIIMPYIGEPVRKLAWEISDQEIADPEWADHIYSLFMYGCNKERN